MTYNSPLALIIIFLFKEMQIYLQHCFFKITYHILSCPKFCIRSQWPNHISIFMRVCQIDAKG